MPAVGPAGPGLPALQAELVGGAGVPGVAVDDAPAVVAQDSSFITREVGFSPVRLAALMALAERLTRPSGVTRQEQQDCSSSLGSKA